MNLHETEDRIRRDLKKLRIVEEHLRGLELENIPRVVNDIILSLEDTMGALARGWAAVQASQQQDQTTISQQASTIAADNTQITTLQGQLASAGSAASVITDPADLAAAQAIIALDPTAGQTAPPAAPATGS